MADLLSPEERAALQEPPAAPGGGLLVAPALFPSVGQLDPERTAKLAESLRRWLDAVVLDLSHQLRLPCTVQYSATSTLDGSFAPGAVQETFWAAVEACPAAYLQILLPRVLAASICERVRGAPFELREDRRLAPSELMLLQDLVRRWLAMLDQAWPELVILPCPTPDPDETATADWLGFTNAITCGGVEGAIHVNLGPLTTRVLLGEAAYAAPAVCAPDRIVARVGDAPVELRAVLGQAEFTLDELSSLRIGDVIALDRKANDPVEIVLQDRTVFRARAGLAGQWVAIELIAEPDEEIHDEH